MLESGQHPPSETGAKLPHWLFAAAFLISALLVGVDLVLDWQQGTEALHLLTEGAAVAVCLVSALALLRRQQLQNRATRQALEESRQAEQRVRERAEALAVEAQRWKAEAEASLRGLGEAIDHQFARWQLTPAEREVGLLLLKGLSMKEIAAVRDTQDRTVRQQARSLYQKAGLGGRAELSAFFLEDLLLPRG